MSIPQHCVDDTADVIRALERSVDDALEHYGRLFPELVKAQTQGNLHPMFMHAEIFARLPALGASLMSARGDAVELHKGMTRTAHKLGLEMTVMISPPESKTWPPAPPPYFGGDAHLDAPVCDPLPNPA